MKVKELKDKLRELGLPVSGRKAELEARLADYEKKISNQLTLYVKTLTGSSYTIKVKKDDKVINLKEKIEERLGIPPNKMRLFYMTFGISEIGDINYPGGMVGKSLKDDQKLLSDYNIANESTISMHVRLC